MGTGERARGEWGERAGVAWFLGGFLVLLACAVLEVGPSGWVAAWQARRFGYVNVVLAFLPGFAGLLAPFAAVACVPRRARGPFLAGFGRVLWQPARPVAARLPPGRVAARLRVMGFACAGVSLAAVLGGGLGAAWMMRTPDPAPGTPLPEVSLAAALRPGAALPSPARLTGVAAVPGAGWTHVAVVRTAVIRDRYVPLVGDGWRAGDPVAALELLHPDADEAVGDAGPYEGTLALGGIPGWQLTAMRAAGIAVGAAPLVLTREDLGGVVPAPDWADAVGPAILGGAVALVSALMAWASWRARRRMLRG